MLLFFAKTIRSFSVCNNFPQNIWISFRSNIK